MTMNHIFEIVENEKVFTCYLMSPRDGEVYRWCHKDEAKAFDRLQAQTGFVSLRRSILELRAPDGTVVGRGVKGIFEDYREIS